ncbi:MULTISPECIES: hypothetical protein [unclassified Corynebacterium]|uniref:hypothetical protein n=1 Tax=unclassified Corynebacterium TaxID=2624378 RepID=UPI002655DF01|nr:MULTISPECIES: hypothetical protein [unclassified Corynebacterium]MDN8594369.1 hypothetical protein [Corynebacterium sp. P4_F2]WKK56170.1 hypothetical protein QYR03_02840 [Corynebacterium sp. P4-C1]
MVDQSQVEQLKLEDFTVEKMARRITEFWGKGTLYDPFADHAHSKNEVPGSGVPGDVIDDSTGGEASQPYLPRADADGKGNNGHYTFEEFYPLEPTAQPQPKNWLTFLHPADREFLHLNELGLSDSETDLKVLKDAIDAMELPVLPGNVRPQTYRNTLRKFLKYLNGDPEAPYSDRKHRKEDDAIYPSVAQPFMGDLNNPKVLVVTFNPGFHKFSDWALGAENLSEEIMKKVKSFDRSESKQQWVKEQDALLRAITGEGVFVPWQLTNGAVPNFSFDPPLNLHGPTMKQWNGNWHTTYFQAPNRNKSQGRLIEFIPLETEGRSEGLAQVDIFPYATKKSKDVEGLIGALKEEYTTEDLQFYSDFRARLWPSQRPILDYILAILLAAAENGTIVVVRSSVEKNYWQAVMKIADTLAEQKGLSPGSLWERCFVGSGQNIYLTLANLRGLGPNGKGDKPTAEDIADLLQPN